MAELKPRHTTRFLASAHVYTPPVEEQMVAMASLDKLRALLPPGVDPETQPALLFVAANLAVGGVVNLNSDALTLNDTLRTYKGFEWQLVDVEHDRNQLRGFIVKAGLSELGTDRLVTEDEARAAGNPVNIAVVLALWKVVDPELCAFIERMDAPASPDRNKLSLSFEVGFDDYDIAVLPNGTTNLALATQIVTPDSPDFGKYDRLLRCNGGKGALGKDTTVSRVIMGNIVPLGAGIVTVPAAAVKGLTTITSNPHAVTEDDLHQYLDAGLYNYSSTQVTLGEADAVLFKAYAAAIPDEHIYTDPKDPTLGRDGEPHCTALYGIVGADVGPIQACLAGCGPITMTLGKVSMFETSAEAKKPYDVLKIDVHGDDLHRIHHLIKTATATETKWPEYHPHLTIAYMQPGMARGYVGDTRFEGKTFTFNSLTFSPHTGDRVEIPLTSPAQSAAAGVYSEDEAMPTPSRQIKLSEGWQTRLAALVASETTAGKQGNAPLVNGVNITLSDGRTFSNVKVFDGQTLELDKELSMSGVIITDMTPGVPPQADDPAIEHPHKADVYPTTTPEQQARDAANEAQRKVAQNAAYTDAQLLVEASLKKINNILSDTGSHVPDWVTIANITTAGVSPSTPLSPMDITQLKQSLAAVKSVEDLPTAVANVALFADAIAAASEKLAAERKTAQEAAAAAQLSVDQIKAELAAITKTHNELVAAQQAAAAEAQFNDHMNVVESAFELDDDIRAEIVSEIKACADGESFTKWLTSAKKKMKGWLKKDKMDDKMGKMHKDKMDDKDPDDAKAAAAAQLALASAAANPVDANHTHDFAATASLNEQMRASFAGGISINGIKVKDITAKK